MLNILFLEGKSIFAIYIGRAYNYTDLAKAYGSQNYTTNCLSVGFIWQMPVF